jgi:hypothetical protein
MDFLSLKTLLVLTSWLVGAWLVVRVWKSADPVFFKIILTLLAAVPAIGPLAVYWISNFPSRLHPDVQAKYPKTVNFYGRWRTEEDEKSTRKGRSKPGLR